MGMLKNTVVTAYVLLMSVVWSPGIHASSYITCNGYHVKWGNFPVNFHVDSSEINGSRRSLLNTIAARINNTKGSSAWMNMVTDNNLPVPHADGKSSIGRRFSSNNLVGITWVWYPKFQNKDCANQGDATISEVDILYNTKYANHFSEHTLIHELGHGFGFEHNSPPLTHMDTSDNERVGLTSMAWPTSKDAGHYATNYPDYSSYKADFQAVKETGTNVIINGNGTFVRFKYSVMNTGNTPASGLVRFYLSNDELITPSDHLVGYANLYFPPRSWAHKWEHISLFPLSLPSGNYYGGVIVDPYNWVSEVHEGNNAALLTMFPLSLNHFP